MKTNSLLEDFENFYLNIYGDRWSKLKKSFLEEKVYVKIENLKKDFFIDEGSFLISELLEIKDGDIILDACSAPGGKLLALMNRLNDSNEVICNELSTSRRMRLKKNIDDFVLDNKKHIIKSITNFDATKIGLFQKEKYDKIFLDVPCSSERHVINDLKQLGNWSKTKSKRLQIQSHAILQSGIMSLKKGGVLVYSTCSISPLENDGVIEKTFKKNKYPFEILDINKNIDYIEKTEYGYQIFPDKSNGRGPIYFSIIKKI